jgi:CHASE2 domain-containing sensor protein
MDAMPLLFTRLPLRTLLLADAATCAAMGGLLLLAAVPVARLTALPEQLLRPAGLLLLAIALFIALVATRPRVPRNGVRVIVLGNLLWIVASLALLLGGWATPNAAGIAVVLVQALGVAALAGLEARALRAPSPGAL